ncbi:hypothetical protein PUNSTDRAFT_140459 [Punctularia strigosozonata HHB-11173 SS5]|uniref:uncharacterized protein n=1 Tax=Punctularia strigosozonata (strain HHB-11173) TaxID=741275 RepID=UPI000441657F|nr:uncharacterized protein PUNSTDRAFT_140459 [Punctularia strigosozonata HHB-11173 SS5]EIN14081.1 hypothetical protein PUNSTDRAFT_140459 [Punctularia strigosozonata HHB-11173 SS5]
MALPYYNDPPPYGWTKEYDPASQHDFWVDTTSSPPRSIWTHPYEDEIFLSQHPEIRERFKNELSPSAGPDSRRHSFHGESSTVRPPAKRNSASHPGTPVNTRSSTPRGIFGRMKDKAIGTKEEREERKLRERELERQQMTQREQALQQLRQQYMQQRQQYQSQDGNRYGRTSGLAYGPPPGNPYSNPYYGRNRSGLSGGNLALPLLGGMAGGLLLGDMLDGGFGGGGFGGGGFGGGGFDGGWGGGGGFF